ncbi:hypothetical protein BDN71DRAFT_1512061 [Pleurotus eryngii]|uniref:Uncharacterized protein n=1 Tax=Pleurotus eryngii TaxID=5323 RepID=A0A9P6DAA5_PLEER|nr:hypothetical protein BDN71DRAFT_1512061 [Pleurotus eryngii]
MTGQYFQFVNFDKRQVYSGLGKSGEFAGKGVVKILMPPRPYPNVDIAFTSIFIGYDLARATSRHGPGLGRLDRLPVELLA